MKNVFLEFSHQSLSLFSVSTAITQDDIEIFSEQNPSILTCVLYLHDNSYCLCLPVR